MKTRNHSPGLGSRDQHLQMQTDWDPNAPPYYGLAYASNLLLSYANSGANVGVSTGANIGASTGANVGASTGANIAANGANIGANAGAKVGANMLTLVNCFVTQTGLQNKSARWALISRCSAVMLLFLHRCHRDGLGLPEPFLDVLEDFSFRAAVENTEHMVCLQRLFIHPLRNAFMQSKKAQIKGTKERTPAQMFTSR